MIFYSEKNPWSFHFQPQPSNNKDHWKREWNNIAKRKLFGVDCTRTNTKQNNIRQGLEGDWASKALKAVFYGVLQGGYIELLLSSKQVNIGRLRIMLAKRYTRL